MSKRMLAILLCGMMMMTSVFGSCAIAETVPEVSQGKWVRYDQDIEHWDEEVDFVIAGFGLAGAAAAIEAYEVAPDAKVAVFEKAPFEFAGGNSIASGQSILFPDPRDIDTFRTYFKALNYPQELPEDYVNWFTQEMADQRDWIAAVAESAGYEVGFTGGGPLKFGEMVIEYMDFPCSNFRGATGHMRDKEGGRAFENGGVWRGFYKATVARGIEVRYGTPVVALVQEPITRRITGVIARTPEGKEIAVKSEKGVLLACGGYENDMELLAHFNGGDHIMSVGTPYNTGDGIRMLGAVGAQFWHMDNHTMSAGYERGIKVPDYDTCFTRQTHLKRGNWMEIAADSTRFYDEAYQYGFQHWKYKSHGQYVDIPTYRSMPVSFIFDESMRSEGGPIVNTWLGWPIAMGNNPYVWSQDNSKEVEAGWIIKADTIEELAVKMGRDPKALRETVDRFNEMVDKGVDEDFGRNIDTMEKIETPPFYGVDLYPSLPATTGGAKRDIECRVLDWNDDPIPNLYEAGELGSFVCNLYQNGTFLSEAIMTGRVAVNTAFGKRSDLKPKEEAEFLEPWNGAADGDYPKVVEGLEGEFEVIYTIKDGNLADIRIGEGRENMFMTDEQFEEFKTRMIEAQDIGVDAVSGATIDSQAISSGMLLAFDPIWLQVKNGKHIKLD